MSDIVDLNSFLFSSSAASPRCCILTEQLLPDRLTGRITSQCVLATETGRKCTLLKRVHEGVRRTEEGLEDDPHAAHQLGQEQRLRGLVKGRRTLALGVASGQIILGELFTVGTVVVRVLSLNSCGDVDGAGHCWKGDTCLD